MRAALLCAALPACLANGCYRYAPLDSSPPVVGSELRLSLTTGGMSTLAPVLGRGTIAAEGRLSSVTDAAYVLAVSATLKLTDDGAVDTTRTVWAGESVTVPRSAVAGVQARTLNRSRTAAAFGVGAIVAAIAVKLIVHAAGSGGSGGDTGGTVVTP